MAGAGMGEGMGIFAGIYVLEPEFYEALPDRPCSVIDEGFRRVMGNYRPHPEGAFGQMDTFTWHDMGTWDDVLAAHMDVLRNLGTDVETGEADIASGTRIPSGRVLPVGPYSRVGALSPGRFLEEERSYIGPGAIVEDGARIGPEAVIGAGATVGRGTTVRHAVVLPGAVVPARADVTGTVVLPRPTLP